MNDRLVQPDAGHPPQSPLREVWSIAWPTVLTMTSYTVMQFMDGLMVGQVGPLPLAAQGNGAIWAFTPIAFAMGVVTVVNTYVSQNLGAGKPENGPKYAWAAIWMCLGIWMLVLFPWAWFLRDAFDLVHFGQIERFTAMLDAADPAARATAEIELGRLSRLIPMETTYGRILLLGGIMQMAGRGVHHYFFGLHRPKIVTISALCGNVTNVTANYVLIFGADGLPALGLPGVSGVPALGVTGAAIGTVIGTTVEFAIPFCVFIGPKMNAELHSRRQWRPRLKPIRELLKIGWPAAVQFGNEITCWSIFMSSLVGMFGTNHQTAGWIALRYMHLSFMPAVGFSVAATSLVGKYIGAGDANTAARRARLCLGIAMMYMTVCALIFFVFRTDLVRFYIGTQTMPAEQTAKIIEIGAALMICAAVFQTLDALGIVYNGALRGAGDTIWPGVITIIYSWAFIVGGGWAMAVLFPQLESVGPWIGAAVYIGALGVTMAVRFESGRWRRIKLLDPAERDAARVAPVGPSLPSSELEASVSDIAEEIGESMTHEPTQR
jgi:MATE family multidrug resistance protein